MLGGQIGLESCWKNTIVAQNAGLPKHLTLPIITIQDFGGVLSVMVLKVERTSAHNSNA
jgi:hypothetical protein